MVKVLFVCLGNICRSPSAEGVFRALVAEHGLGDRIAVDSAGTGDYHIGEAPDSRAQAEARRRGFDISALKARQVRLSDFHDFDYMIAMDRRNHAELEALRPGGARAHLRMLLDFAPELARDEVPDPYLGGAEGFAEVLEMIEAGARGLLSEVRVRCL